MPTTVRTGRKISFTVSQPVLKVKTNTAGTEIEFEVVTAAGASLVILWREFGDTAWNESSALNSPIAGSTKTIDTLTADHVYQFMPVACSEAEGRGARSDPGNLMQITTIDASGDLALEGSFSSPIDKLRTLLANSATFQAMTETNNAAEAKQYIFLIGGKKGEVPRDGTTGKINKAFAWIDEDKEYSHREIAGGAKVHMSKSGALFIKLTAPIPDEYADDLRKLSVWFYNRIGKICDEMNALSGSSDYLAAREISQGEGPYRSSYGEKETQGNLWEFEIKVRWGI